MADEVVVADDGAVFIDTKEWWKSRTMIGSVVTVAALLLNLSGFNVTPTMEGESADLIMEVVAVGGAIFAMVGRALATKNLK